ncbi:MAG: hypothetical protein HZA88_00700 [Verrucomicrobia bacterium]|nr:hypothetical protein [Verrucomicrobiota bacterium]
MKTQVWALVLAVVAGGWDAFANGETSASPEATAAVADTGVVDAFWKNFSRAKELEALVKKAEKRVEDLGLGKEFLAEGVLKSAEQETQWWRDKYYNAIDALANYTTMGKFSAPGAGSDALGDACLKAAKSEKVKTAHRDAEVAERAAKQADENEKELAKKEEDLAKAGKTEEAREVRDRIPAAKQKTDKAKEAARKAHNARNQAIFDELKRAEVSGTLPPPSNARQIADAEPKASEPAGTTKLRGHSECLPGPGPGAPVGVKTTLRSSIGTVSQDGGGVQRTNSLQPRIFYLPLPSFRPGTGGGRGDAAPVAGGKKSD